MKTKIETEQSADRLVISLPETPRELRLWLIDQITILAEAFGEELTDVRLRLYAEDLAELPRAQLQTALNRARRELRFFPKISELRDLAEAKAEDIRNVEAEAAWTWANDYLRKWGVDRLPVYSAGKRIDPPSLPRRIEYSLRRIGGLPGLNQITAESRPFMFKDFCAAYSQAPIAESMGPQLAGLFGEKKLLGHLKQLSSGEPDRRRSPAIVQTFRAKPIAEPMAEVQLRDRRDILRQQAAALRDRATKAAVEASRV